MESEDRIPKITDYRESAVSLKYKIRLFWMILFVFVLAAVIEFGVARKVPYHRALGYLNVAVAILLLGVINVLRKRYIEKQSEAQGLEGDGGRQRT